MTNELQSIDAYMANLRWRRDVNYGGEVSYIRPDHDYCVRLEDGYWELCDFTDGDVSFEGHTEAVGRFETMESGETLMELIAALRGCGRMTPPVRKPEPVAMTVAMIGNGLFVRVGRKR